MKEKKKTIKLKSRVEYRVGTDLGGGGKTLTEESSSENEEEVHGTSHGIPHGIPHRTTRWYRDGTGRAGTSRQTDYCFGTGIAGVDDGSSSDGGSSASVCSSVLIESSS
ncbi:hypothetical protein M0802_007705 [Mischocyttarus mexicanus]|nr:hypothetical protein M0802_007705 [Mischocyttarus mexicanus]